jgi:hypothetical protein
MDYVLPMGGDQMPRVGAFWRGRFAPKHRWPRHAGPDDLPACLASEVLQGRFPCATVHRYTGNHLALRVMYWPSTRAARVAPLPNGATCLCSVPRRTGND